MNPSKIDTPVLVETLREKAGFTDDEIDFYLSLLTIKKLQKKEHYLMIIEVIHFFQVIERKKW